MTEKVAAICEVALMTVVALAIALALVLVNHL